MTDSDWLTCADFAPHVGEEFGLTVDGTTRVSMVLAEAVESTEPGGPGPEGQERRQFSLVFRGPLEPALAQGTFRMSHDAWGDLELFLVPISRDGDGLRYEAAFA